MWGEGGENPVRERGEKDLWLVPQRRVKGQMDAPLN